MSFIIELDAESCSAYHINGSSIKKKSKLGIDLAACTKSGDAEPACRYIIEKYKPEFKIMRKVNDNYIYEVATHNDKIATCKRIYFESNTDFPKSEESCDLYLVWDAAHQLFQ